MSLSPPHIADLIMTGFEAYLRDFRAITRRAPERFAQQDWHGIQADSRERLTLYKTGVGKIARKVRRTLRESYHDFYLWRKIKASYARLALSRYEFELAETFFNSVCRKVLGDIGAEPDCMFVSGGHLPPNYTSDEPIYHHYKGAPLQALFTELLEKAELQTPFQNLDRDIAYILDRVEQEILPHQPLDERTSLEVLKAIFYRNKAAYVVGRLFIGGTLRPFIIPFLQGEGGIYADTLVIDPDEASTIFSFTRSYFLVDVRIPSELVDFLKSIMPRKPYSDLYNSIGFNKHGKTELYRDFVEHLTQSDDLLELAPGTKGLVMAVFTLPSYHIVFKLIRDESLPPKVTNRSMVRAKYRLVSRHDRVGRMADTHEFEKFILPLARFSESLLQELLAVAPDTVQIQGDQVLIKHLYTERKMTPLNLYLEQVEGAALEEVVDEYGNTIKQLAAANIFPGDMLLKNFGVTRHRRVVFYDYDEIGLLTEYNFRKIPKATSLEEVYAPSPWFAVGPKDVFPEEFRHFLIGKIEIESLFVRLHAELFEVAFWWEMQERQRRGEIIDVFPYSQQRRFPYLHPAG